MHRSPRCCKPPSAIMLLLLLLLLHVLGKPQRRCLIPGPGRSCLSATAPTRRSVASRTPASWLASDNCTDAGRGKTTKGSSSGTLCAPRHSTPCLDQVRGSRCCELPLLFSIVAAHGLRCSPSPQGACGRSFEGFSITQAVKA